MKTPNSSATFSDDIAHKAPQRATWMWVLLISTSIPRILFASIRIAQTYVLGTDDHAPVLYGFLSIARLVSEAFVIAALVKLRRHDVLAPNLKALRTFALVAEVGAIVFTRLVSPFLFSFVTPDMAVQMIMIILYQIPWFVVLWSFARYIDALIALDSKSTFTLVTIVLFILSVAASVITAIDPVTSVFPLVAAAVSGLYVFRATRVVEDRLLEMRSEKA